MLECRGVTVQFDGVMALDRVDLTVASGSTAAVMGPSGSGKSTLLRVIAGLQRPDTGVVRWRGHDLTGVPPHRRPIGLMFQDYALFPHLTVHGNVAFGLRMQDQPADAIGARVSETLELVGLAGFEDRPIDDLSGGEQQRVALARTLAPRPELLLLDEPLGALDRVLRNRLLPEMRDIFAGLELTVLYVTHDTDEAFGVAGEVAVMDHGRIVQTGSPEALWTAPATGLVATLVGHPNVLAAADVPGLLPPDVAEFVVVPPDAIDLDGSAAPNGVVVESRFAAERFDTTVRIGDVELITHTAAALEPGRPVRISIAPDALVPVERRPDPIS